MRGGGFCVRPAGGSSLAPYSIQAPVQHRPPYPRPPADASAYSSSDDSARAAYQSPGPVSRLPCVCGFSVHRGCSWSWSAGVACGVTVTAASACRASGAVHNAQCTHNAQCRGHGYKARFQRVNATECHAPTSGCTVVMHTTVRKRRHKAHKRGAPALASIRADDARSPWQDRAKPCSKQGPKCHEPYVA